jgi:uncharacterized protein (TIRG00374 family)
MASDRVKSLLGFVVAVAVLGVILWWIGFEDVTDALSKADLGTAALTIPVAALWLTFWGLSLYTVLGALDVEIRPHRAVFVFVSAVFINNVTPLGQAGGEPISAVLISSEANTEYETGLAAITSVDTLHFVPSLSLASVGLAYVGLSAIDLTRNILFAIVGVVVFAAVVPTIGYLIWRNRERFKRTVAKRVTGLVGVLSRVLPFLSDTSEESVAGRVDGFFEAIGRVATDRRTVLTAMSFSALGWISLSLSLWLSLHALGFTISFVSILFVVPLGSIAGATPLPGGLGGIEAAFATLLVPLGIPISVAFSAVLIHRGATFWLPTLFGGGAATLLSMQAKRVD